MTVAKRGALSAAAILVHVTVIRATTGTPRPFNDFYPLANVPRVCTCEISRVCAAISLPCTGSTVIISSPGEITPIHPLQKLAMATGGATLSRGRDPFFERWRRKN